MKKSAKIIVIMLVFSILCTLLTACGEPEVGPKGDKGDSGKDGKSAYEIAVAEGFDGSAEEWLLSLVGQKGNTGNDGVSPKLRINTTVNDWEISYDNGATWTGLGVPATGDKGIKGDKGDMGIAPKLKINTATNMWEVSYDNGTTYTSLGVAATGDKGNTGNDGISPKLKVNDTTNMWEISYDNGTTYTSLGVLATGAKGDKGDKGDTGIVPVLRIDEESNLWEVSYDNGKSYESLGIPATGDKGDKGDEGISPELRVNTESNKWEISYDKGKSWESLGIAATGEKGDKGDKGDTGVTPLLRINEESNMWEVSYDNGETYESLNIPATGDKGDKGDTGDTGKSAYEIYVDQNPEYAGTEEQWLHDVLNGTLTKYEVTFDLNGGVAGADFNESLVVGCGKSIALTVPTKEGYTFLGWYTGDSVTDGIFTTTDAVTGNLDLVARWQINTLTVTFLDYYGDTVNVQTVDYGTAATAPEIPEKITEEKVYFDGWDKDFDKVTKDMTVKAAYSHRVYKVTYDTDGGSSVSGELVYSDELPTKPSDPTKTDFIFEGWYLDEAYTERYNFDTALNEDTVIYANMCEYIMIRTAEDLMKLQDSYLDERKYMLANDINLEGNLWTPMYIFAGTLDGNGHKIYNFAISGTDTTMGFIKHNSGIVRNIVFENVSFVYTNSFTAEDSSFTAGVIAGSNSNIIENCELRSGSILFDITNIRYGRNTVTLGAIAGSNSGKILNCINRIDVEYKLINYDTDSGAMTLPTYLSSGVGRNYSIIEGTELYGNINCAVSTGGYSNTYKTTNLLYIGAVCGENASSSAKISKCSADVGIVLNHTQIYTCSIKNSIIGTLCGRNYGTVEDSKAEGSIDVTNTGTVLTSQIGGAVGYNCENSKITNLYSTVDITTGSSVCGTVGGVVGESAAGSSVLKSVYVGNLDITSEITNYGLVAGLNSGTVHNCYYSDRSMLEVNGVSGTATLSAGTAEDITVIKTQDFIYNKLFWKSDVWDIKDGFNPSLK